MGGKSSGGCTPYWTDRQGASQAVPHRGHYLCSVDAFLVDHVLILILLLASSISLGAGERRP